MSRYDWPRPAKGRSGKALQRIAYNLGRDAGTDPDNLHPPAAADEAEGPQLARSAGPDRVAPHSADGLWQPLGPAVTLRGTGDSDPRVAGRVRDLAVTHNGQRCYAASALGGLWYSGDRAESWSPVGNYSTTARADLAASSMVLATGALHVRFGADTSLDEVWVGTGEPNPRQQPTDFGSGGYYGGVGILHATGPVLAAPGADPWGAREAQPRAGYVGLRGAGVFSIVADPDDPHRLLAATTRGVHVRNAASGEWSTLVVPQWETALGPDGSARVMVSDVVWVRVGADTRVWIAAAAPNQDARVQGLWRSDGALGAFTRVDLTGVTTNPQRRTLRRIGLAAAPSDSTVVYALANGPRLWRVDGDATVRRVRPIPTLLFGGAGSDQSEYDLALAVDPRNPRHVLVGGSTVTSTIDTAMPAAALFRLQLPATAPSAAAAWSSGYTGGNAGSDAWVGAEVHPDVHRIRWVPGPGAAADPGHVFVGCDGGVFRSAADAETGSFTSRGVGLGVNEPGFLASHPTSDGIVLAGVQDNGVQLRIGESVWRRALLNGDGGGVAFDPGRPDRFIGQATNSSWTTDGDADADPLWRTSGNATYRSESGASRFYSNAAALRRADGVTQLAVGTTRVWYSEQWGRKFAAGPVWGVTWRTLPSRSDPRANDAADLTTDRLRSGPHPPGTIDTWATGVRVLRWADEHRLYAVMPGAVHRLERNPGNLSWQPVRRIALRTATSPVAPAVGPGLPRDGALNDLAVHLPREGTHGSFYLATSHPLEPVWWFDGTDTWHPCTLGTVPPGTRAAAYSVVVDPDDRDVVYAGTTVGVWRGELTRPAVGAPTWVWAEFTNGLPEAAVQDLIIDSYPLAQGGTVKLLRAAVQARGVWEVELGAPTARLVYLRSHPYDTRRSRPTPMADPLLRPAAAQDREWHLDWADVRNRDFRTGPATPAPHPDGTPAGHFSWHASPDVRVRPAPGAAPLAAPATLPWTRRPADRYALWALQTALHALDPQLVPDGRWTAMFRRRLRTLRRARGLPNVVRVDADLWNHADVQAGFWSDPFAVPGRPTEADLAERITGQATPRVGVGAPLSAAVSPASLAMPPVAAKVDVCLHARGLADVAPGDAAVTLLKLGLPADPADWGPVAPFDFAGLATAMAAVAAAGGTPPAGTVPAPWSFADAGTAVRRPAAPLAAARPGVLTFDTSFVGDPVGSRWLLLVVLTAGAGTPAVFGAGTVRDLVLASPHVAARSVEVV